MALLRISSSLAYECEAMVPIEVGVGSFRTDHYDPETNEVNHHLYVDMIEEVRTNSQLKVGLLSMKDC